MTNNWADQQMTEGDFMLNTNCNKYALMCIPHDYEAAYSLSAHWFSKCRDDRTISPKKLALAKCPHLFNPEYQRRLKKLNFRRGF